MKYQQYFKQTALLFAFSFGSLLPSVQAQIIQWDKTIGGSADDGLSSLVQTSDGGYLLGGYSASDISGDKTHALKGIIDYWVVKLDNNGSKLWDRTIGGNLRDNLVKVIETSDGYILGGWSASDISGDKTHASKGGVDYWIIKLDVNGNKLWDKTIGGNDFDYLSSLVQTTDGGYLLGGYSVSGISGDKTQAVSGTDDYWIVKLDANGNKLWDKTIGGSGADKLYSLVQASDGGYLLGGTSDSDISDDKTQNSQGNRDYWVVKLDAGGNKLWDKTIGGNAIDQLVTLVQTSDGGYFLGGYSLSGISGDKTQAVSGTEDYWVVKLDANGNKLWDKTIGGSDADRLYSLARVSDGYILGGWSASNISGDKTQASKGGFDYWIVKLDASGNKLWDKTIGGSDSDNLMSLAQTSDGGYLLGGLSHSGIAGDKTEPNSGISDYWIVKLSGNTTGIADSKVSFPLTISPNPSQGKFQLQGNNLTAKTAAITVSDLLGRIVYQQQLPVTGKQIQQEINLHAAKGIYHMQLNADGQRYVQKLIIE